mgnify:CR=1 FL=1
MDRYCDVCNKVVQTDIVTMRETYEVFGESVDVDARVMVCTECGEDLFCEELDNTTLLTVYNTYRKRHNLLMPEEIRHVRELRGLSQKEFENVLGCDWRTVRRYENGAVQTEEFDKAVRSLMPSL